MPIRADLRHLYRTPEARKANAVARARAGGACERCGTVNHQVYLRACAGCGGSGRWRTEATNTACADCVGTGRTEARAVLTVAHLDHDPGNNSLTNLAVLCQKCHLAHDRPAHTSTRIRRRDSARGQLRFGE